jgi:radical SAM superfamily enzyme YgiQ (UPF0313 family)
MQKVTVGLVQINNSFSNQDYFPYSVGLLQAYAQQHAPNPGRYEFLLPIFRRVRVDWAVERLFDAQVVGFSTYVWNYRISLAIAERLKRLRPETLIVFGGPHVPERSEAFLRQHRFIDLCCHGEGEQVFLKILENYPSPDWMVLPSVSYLDRQGSFVRNQNVARLRDLSLVPSPYLAGVFDALMEANAGGQWLALWETNRGCPFSCTFCDWGSAIQTKVTPFALEDRLFREITWFAQKKIEFVFCCDANYGILPRDLEITRRIIQAKEQYGYPRAFSVQNTKNATERAYQVQKLLSDAGLNKGVAIALQSVDPGTLKSIKRQNISTETYQELQRRFTRDGVETYTDLILGLPGENYDAFADGVAKVIQEGQHNRIQFNNLSILPNAEMGDPEYQKKYGMELVESKIINIHGSLLEEEEIHETQHLVIATSAMPRPDWVKTRAFSWTAALLHFDKLLQIPFVLLNTLAGIRYRELIEAFIQGDLRAFPILAEIRDFFRRTAAAIQNGGPEYCRSEDWLNIWWPADEYVFIKLSVEGRLHSFYREAQNLLLLHLPRQQSAPLSSLVLHEAITLNQSLVKQPFQVEDLDLEFSHDVWECYLAAVRGEQAPLRQVRTRYHIDRTSESWSSWDDWCREVVWYGNKKGAYLYGRRAVECELAGHY